MALRVKINPEKIPDRAQPLSIYKLTVKRQSREVLHEVSFELGQGEILGIIGSSGSGKSTLVHTLTGTLDIPSDSITYHHALCNSFEFMNKTPAQRYQMGLHSILEDNQLFNTLTVRENFVCVTSHANRKKVHDRIKDIIELFPQMTELLDRKVNTLTMGQKRIVSIARSIIIFPSILLLDEPTKGLDPVAIEALQDVLKVLTTGSISLLICGENNTFIEDIAQRTLILKNGKLGEAVAIASRGNEWKPQ